MLLPEDVWLSIMLYVRSPGRLAAVCRAWYGRWRANYVTIAAPPPVDAAEEMRAPFCLRVDLLAGRCLPVLPTGMDIGRLRNLVLVLPGDRGGDQALSAACAFASGCGTLRSLELCARACRVSDGVFAAVPGRLAPTLSRLCVRVPMNSLTGPPPPHDGGGRATATLAGLPSDP